MPSQKKEISALLPYKIKEGERIIDKSGRIETIYGIETDCVRKYFSTISIDDERFVILKTYIIKENNKKENRIEEIFEQKRNLLKNLEKATLSQIEKDIGENNLTSQLN